MSALDMAIESVGGLSELARALDVKPQHIVNWKARGIPAPRVLAIEKATNGTVTRHDLRPDLYPKDQAA